MQDFTPKAIGFGDLSDDAISNIMELLPLAEVIRARQVCKQFRDALDHSMANTRELVCPAQIGNEKAVALLKLFRGLDHLILVSSTLTAAVVPVMKTTCASLTSISFRDCYITEEFLLQVTREFPNLQSVEIVGCPLIPSLSAVKKHCRNLQRLSYIGMPVKQKQVIAILKNNPRLVHLKVMSLYEEHADQLVFAILTRGNFVSLELGVNLASMEPLAKCGGTLTVLALPMMPLSSQGMTALWFPLLQSLEFCAQQWVPRTELVLAALPLRVLRMHMAVSIADEVVTFIAVNCPHLQELTITGAKNVSSEAWRSLAALKHLRVLDVCATSFGDSALRKLTKANSPLQRLHVDRTEVSPGGVLAALERCPRLARPGGLTAHGCACWSGGLRRLLAEYKMRQEGKVPPKQPTMNPMLTPQMSMVMNQNGWWPLKANEVTGPMQLQRLMLNQQGVKDPLGRRPRAFVPCASNYYGMGAIADQMDYINWLVPRAVAAAPSPMMFPGGFPGAMQTSITVSAYLPSPSTEKLMLIQQLAARRAAVLAAGTAAAAAATGYSTAPAWPSMPPPPGFPPSMTSQPSLPSSFLQALAQQQQQRSQTIMQHPQQASPFVLHPNDSIMEEDEGDAAYDG